MSLKYIIIIIINNYGAPWWTIFGDELSECRRDVGLSCDVSAFNLRRSMCRLSKIDDRCVDLRRSKALCQPSKTDDRCEIMLPHLIFITDKALPSIQTISKLLVQYIIYTLGFGCG